MNLFAWIGIGCIGFLFGFGAAMMMKLELEKTNDELFASYKEYVSALERRHDIQKKLELSLIEKVNAQDELIKAQDEYIDFLKSELEHMKRDMKLLAQNSFAEGNEMEGEEE